LIGVGSGVGGEGGVGCGLASGGGGGNDRRRAAITAVGKRGSGERGGDEAGSQDAEYRFHGDLRCSLRAAWGSGLDNS
jgi:hypothetical protein